MPLNSNLSPAETFLRRMDIRIGRENRQMEASLRAWAEVLDALGWNVALALPGNVPLLNRGAEIWAAGFSVTGLDWQEITSRLAEERPAQQMKNTQDLHIWADAGGREITAALPPATSLTRRESEVLRWLREGKTGPEITIILGCGQRTVESHVAGIYRKLGIHCRSGLILQHGRGTL